MVQRASSHPPHSVLTPVRGGAQAFLLPTVLALAALALAPAAAPAAAGRAARQPRSAQPLADRARQGDPATFDAAQSAGLFVGVRSFTNDQDLAEVRYAVDDAVDLAFLLALDVNVKLLPPGRVILALSGEPAKPESEQRLQALKNAGAKVYPAGQADILKLLDLQAGAAGPAGMLIIAFASHGFSEEGNHYLVTATSLLQHRETAIPAAKVFDLAARSAASRRLIFLDACRE